MSEYISKEILLYKTVKKNNAWLHITNAEGKNLKEIVDELPLADVRKNIYGHWIDNGNGSYTCSNCKTEWTTSQIEKMCFCSTCGADMRN